MYKVNLGIKLEDCPPPAQTYPGKMPRNNKTGSLQSRQEYIDSEIEKWVRHFDNAEKYHKTFFAD